MRKFFYIFSLLSVGSIFLFSVSAQELKRKTQKLIEKSKESLYQRDWNSAVQYIEEAVDKEPDNHLVYLAKANLYYGARKLEEVVPALKKAYSLEEKWPREFVDYYFILGKENFDAGKYNAARGPLLQYKKSGFRSEYLEMTDLILKSVEYAIPRIAEYDSASYNIVELETGNIFRSTYFPFFTLYPSEFLYFTAQRKGSLSEGIYRAAVKDEKLVRVEEVPVINTRENEGAAAISADGRVMVYTSCNRRGGFGSCDLYISYQSAGEWQQPENLGSTINTAAWESQPFLSSDGRLLIFSSNRKGGYGKRDLYYSVKNEEGWSEAKNLGESVNTFADEISPYLSFAGDRLYFSSNGMLGFGGFDLFSASWPLKSTSTVENLGLPYNSYKNELSYHKRFDGREYWSRESKSSERYPPSKILFTDGKDETVQAALVYGTVSDASSDDFISAKVQVVDLLKDSVVQETQTDLKDGLYKIIIPRSSEYSFYVEADDYLFQSTVVEVKENERRELNFQLEPIQKGASIALNNIYFEFDSYELNKKSNAEIRKLANFLRANKQIRIEVGGYTDQVGTDTYNQKLSLQRAEEVKKALVDQGIPQQIIRVKGYGATAQKDGQFRKIVKVRVL